MKIQVLFFGATADVVGERKIEIDAKDGTRADEVFQKVIGDYPQLNNHSLLFAHNQEYTKGSNTIKDGDELAIFTHVSGG